MNEPGFLLSAVGAIVGGVAAYFGAMNAIRENLARLDERATANKALAEQALHRADRAHERIDNMQG